MDALLLFILKGLRSDLGSESAIVTQVLVVFFLARQTNAGTLSQITHLSTYCSMRSRSSKPGYVTHHSIVLVCSTAFSNISRGCATDRSGESSVTANFSHVTQRLFTDG